MAENSTSSPATGAAGVQEIFVTTKSGFGAGVAVGTGVFVGVGTGIAFIPKFTLVFWVRETVTGLFVVD